MKVIYVQCVVNRSEEIDDIYMSIMYDSMITTRLFILRVVTMTLLLRIVLRIVLQLVIFT